MDEVPIVRGSHGLTGRNGVRPAPEATEPDGFDDDGNPFWFDIPTTGLSLPSNCLRVLSSPLPTERLTACGTGFGAECVGRQRDGGCIADIVRRANAQGKKWSFDFDPRDERWVYAGEALDG